MMKTIIGFGILTMVGCGGAGAPGLPATTPEQVQQSTSALQQSDAVQVVAASNDFGLRLLSRLVKVGENVFVSPVSISTAIAMAYNGADGTTKAEMAKVLGWQSMDLEKVNSANQNLLRVLQHADPKVVTQVANSVWAKQGFPIEPSFLQRCEKFYDADVRALDFAAPNSPDEINTWVSQKTNEKIKKIVESIPEETRMFIINATYFHGKWKEPFKKENTTEGVFYSPSGEVEVPMMMQRGIFAFVKGNGFSALSMPYGDGKRISMLIVLPDRGKDWRTILKAALESRQSSSDVIVKMPKFKTEYKTSLSETLSIMGMPTAFIPDKADFSGISKFDNLYLMDIVHKSYVDVNEEGTEAAAVTEIKVGATSAPADPIEFTVDRPFVFFIRDEVTKTLLFTGYISNPK